MNILHWARRHQPELIHLIQEFVECESPSDAPAEIGRFQNLLADSVSEIATVRRTREGALICKFGLPDSTKGSSKKRTQILALGHADTVWPLGTLKTMPFRRARGRLCGPGVLDMKAGLVFFIFAMRALRELQIPVAHEVDRKSVV